MDENFRKQMEESGADVETTIKRFMGKEELYVKFILKFLDDSNLDLLLENYGKKDFGAVFNNAHSIKGVTSNLGLNPVYKVSAEICDLLRGKQPEEVDEETLSVLKDQLAVEYGRFRKIIGDYKQASGK